ncbi:MAG: TolC family outer membrane protein [Steroidobacteraceae bacterium]
MLRFAPLGTLALLLVTQAAAAEDLLAVYQRALDSDPQIREAEALRRANRESKPQALAALLPQLSGVANYTDNKFEGTSDQAQIVSEGPNAGELAIFGTSGTREPETKSWSVELSQSVFRWENWVALRRADKQVAQAEADYAAAEQDLILRVSTAYFDVLAARDTLDAQQANLQAVSRQLEQAEKRFEVGLIAITDVQESRAARDNAAADVIAAKRQLATAEEGLREVTGARYATLDKPGDELPLEGPEPANEDDWVRVAMDQNLALISSRLAADIARDDVRSAFGGHLPSIDLTASYGNQRTTTDQTFPAFPPNFPNERSVALENDTDATLIGLQFTLPIFSGGGTRSRVRQQEFLWQAARQRLERTSRETERQARDAFLGVTSEISRVNALKQALESSRTALQATEAGYEVGTRTTVDVLQARRNLVQAFTNLSRSKYDYLLNVIRLRQAAGTLDRAALEEINGWLDQTVSTVPPPPTGSTGTTTP